VSKPPIPKIRGTNLVEKSASIEYY
jgi:hypothetical protein